MHTKNALKLTLLLIALLLSAMFMIAIFLIGPPGSLLTLRISQKTYEVDLSTIDRVPETTDGIRGKSRTQIESRRIAGRLQARFNESEGLVKLANEPVQTFYETRAGAVYEVILAEEIGPAATESALSSIGAALEWRREVELESETLKSLGFKTQDSNSCEVNSTEFTTYKRTMVFVDPSGYIHLATIWRIQEGSSAAVSVASFLTLRVSDHRQPGSDVISRTENWEEDLGSYSFSDWLDACLPRVWFLR